MRRAVLGVILSCLLIYHVNGRPQAEVDCVAAPYAAWSLVRHGSLDLRYYPDLRYLVPGNINELADGSWVSIRPVGSALAALPVVAPFAILSEQPLRPTNMQHLGKLVGALSAAAAAGLFFLICRRLFPEGAWPATLLFALGTSLWSVASQALWMHAPATFWLCLALYLLTGPRSPSRAVVLVAGLALGLATATRPTTTFFALATGLVLLRQRQLGRLVWLTLGGAIPVAGLCLLNTLHFGSPIAGGYVHDNWTEKPPLWLGLSGLLVAPSRGLLVYSPALILVPWGIGRLVRRPAPVDPSQRSLLLAWLAAAGATLLFYARWHMWWGGWCFGPRFLCETMPLLCLLFAAAYASLRAAWQRRAAEVLVALSIAVQLVGVFGHHSYAAWQSRHDLYDQGRCLFALHDTQIGAHTQAVFRALTGRRKD